MIRVMLVDDHALVRMGFRMLLANSDIDVVAEAQTGEEACQQVPKVKPDVVVMDLTMPVMGGLEAVRRLLAERDLAEAKDEADRATSSLDRATEHLDEGGRGKRRAQESGDMSEDVAEARALA